jgi:uncharacterized protein
MSSTATVFDAIAAGDVEHVRRIVAADPAASAARDADGLSAVLRARYRFHLEIVDVLLAADPDLDLFDAAAVGRTDRVWDLLGAQPNLARAYAADGFTALQLASFFGHVEPARLLLDAGADVNAVSRNQMQVQPLHSALAGRHHALCELLLERGAQVNTAQQDGFTPLHEAAQHGDRRLVDMLLARGADRLATKTDGETPAATAASHGHPEIAALLTVPT